MGVQTIFYAVALIAIVMAERCDAAAAVTAAVAQPMPVPLLLLHTMFIYLFVYFDRLLPLFARLMIRRFADKHIEK